MVLAISYVCSSFVEVESAISVVQQTVVVPLTVCRMGRDDIMFLACPVSVHAYAHACIWAACHHIV